MYNYLPEELIEEVRLSNDIVDVVSEYVRLEKRGKYFFGLCPFHNEKTPSFSVTPAMQIFNCFGCNKGGNVIHFIMNIENLDFIEAVKYLADRAGIKLPEGKRAKDDEAARLRQEILEINKTAARYFYENIVSSTGAMAREYLKKRDILDRTMKRFGLGYSLPENDHLYKYLLNKGFSKKAIIESGLILKTNKEDYIDRFRDRLMFPIFDVRGNVIGFGGRVLGSSMPKYMNSPETLVYNKGSNLYALNFARSSGERKLIVVEGYMDVISLHQNGIINSVASLGTALTENQGRLLRKYAEEIIMSFDADTAGQTATIRSLDLLSGMGCVVKVLTIPEGKDPDDFIRKSGADEFRKLIDNAMTLVEYKINYLKRQIDTNNVEGKIRFINRAAEVLSKLNSRVEIEIYVKKIAGEYGISEESLYAEVLKQLSPKKIFKEVKTYTDNKEIKSLKPKESNKEKDICYAELLLFAILCIDNSLYKLIKDKISINDFTNTNKEIATVVFRRLDEGAGIITGELLNIMDTETAGEFARIIEKDCNFEDIGKAVLDVVNRITVTKLKERKKEILKILKNRDSMEKEEVRQLLEEINILVRELKNH
ncbi:MAG: DNA primase [Firmicutes bacterium]|nr:DNA primase [Bacillota bacterium]